MSRLQIGKQCPNAQQPLTGFAAFVPQLCCGDGLSPLPAANVRQKPLGLRTCTKHVQIAVISQQMCINTGPKVQQHLMIVHQNRIFTNRCQIRTKFNQILAKCLPETNILTDFDKAPAVFGCHFPWHFLGISMELHANWLLPTRAWLFVKCVNTAA